MLIKWSSRTQTVNIVVGLLDGPNVADIIVRKCWSKDNGSRGLWALGDVFSNAYKSTMEADVVSFSRAVNQRTACESHLLCLRMSCFSALEVIESDIHGNTTAFDIVFLKFMYTVSSMARM